MARLCAALASLSLLAAPAFADDTDTSAGAGAALDDVAGVGDTSVEDITDEAASDMGDHMAADLGPDVFAVSAPAVASQTREHIHVTFNGYFLGFRVMKTTIEAEITGDTYETTANFRTAGLAGMFKVSRIQALANGAVNGSGLEPIHYEHRNLASSKNRVIQIDFTPDDTYSTVIPEFGSMGVPPATREERLPALDPISAFLSIGVEGGDAPCVRTVPIFDGKQRYDLRFEPVEFEPIRVRGYRGDAWRCNVFYTPVSGFDPEDLAAPEDYARPMEMWLADMGDNRWVPVRIRARVSGVRVSIEAKRVWQIGRASCRERV